MKNIFSFLVIFGLLFQSLAYAGIPPQAQASTLAVPEPKHLVPPHEGTFPYVSAIVVAQCRQAIELLYIDDHGVVHPGDLRGKSLPQLLEEISRSAPADALFLVTVNCSEEKSI